MTQASQKIASILLADRQGLSTRHGWKTAEGIADLIDEETAALDMLIALQMVSRNYGKYLVPIDHNIVDKAIAKATAVKGD
jgi:hypothetical protein